MAFIKNNFEIILASTSKIRKKILEDVSLDFKVIAPEFDEEIGKKEIKKQKSPQNLAYYLALQKALSISKKFPNKVIIGSDQICEFDGKEYDKSKNLEDAKKQLSKFNGNVHFQNNSVVICYDSKVIFKNNSKVKLKMRKLSQDEIDHYVNFDKPVGCAGSYKYESLGKHLFEEVKGDYYSILGLTIQPLLNFLFKEKIIEFHQK
jgi:septum formation protein